MDIENSFSAWKKSVSCILNGMNEVIKNLWFQIPQNFINFSIPFFDSSKILLQ